MFKLFELIESLIVFLINSLDFMASSFANGTKFFLALFINIPSLFFDLFKSLPEFVQIGFTGVFGFSCLVVFLKLFSLVKLS